MLPAPFFLWRWAMIDYRDVPPLATYLNRIGAEQLTFKRFMVKEHHGNYYTEKCLIRITDDAKIVVSNHDYAPTDEEQKQIDLVLEPYVAKWPKSILATDAAADDLIAKQDWDRKNVYRFYSRKERDIIMLQVRIDRSDGGKDYLPWTRFSD